MKAAFERVSSEFLVRRRWRIFRSTSLLALLLLLRRLRPRAPPRLLLRLFLRLAMYRQRTGRVDRWMVNPSYFNIRFMILKELFPMRYALTVEKKTPHFFLCVNGVCVGRVRRKRRTWSSLVDSPRKSCVRWSLKQPVPNARAASTPALICVRV